MDERDHKAMNEELNKPSCLGTEEQLNERILLIKTIKVMDSIETNKEITRFEIINHADDNELIQGRVLVLLKEDGEFNNITLSYQDDGKTLKIFLS